MQAPPPSVFGQQSKRRSGSTTQRDARYASSVIGFFICASGFLQRVRAAR